MNRISKVFILVFISICLVSCQNNFLPPKDGKADQKSIDVIYLYQSTFGSLKSEYKIDLKNKKVWRLTSERQGSIYPRNSANNEGYTFVRKLKENKIEAFMLASSRNGFTDWKSSYDNANIDDGLQWGITICFSDGTQKIVYGSNAYPETWKPMCAVFQSLTRIEILPIGASD